MSYVIVVIVEWVRDSSCSLAQCLCTSTCRLAWRHYMKWCEMGQGHSTHNAKATHE